MKPAALDKLIAALCHEQMPDAAPWEVAEAARLIADRIGTDASITVIEVRSALKMMNGFCHFDHTRLVAEAWDARQGFDATIRKHHAQALINTRALSPAEALLQAAIGTVAGSNSAQQAKELNEFHGLLGRIFKQRFVESGDLDDLGRAQVKYLTQYQATDEYWLGINAVALQACQDRRHVRMRVGGITTARLAKRVLNQALEAHEQNRRDPWGAATASEAHLALGDCDGAELWLCRFLRHPAIYPFAVDSYGRQLREIWEADVAGGTRCADHLAGLVARYQARTQHTFSVSPADVPRMREALETDSAELEKNFSGEGTISLDMLRRMMANCSAIGCVSTQRGERLGTGFLVNGTALHTSFGPGPVFVTNAHVISDAVPNAIPVRDALVSFEVESAAAGRPVFYPVGELLFTSPPGTIGVSSEDAMDVTIVRLRDLPDRVTTLAASTALPLIDSRTKVYVVGHPRGSGLQLSLHDSVLLDYDDEERLLHYRTPTDPGSSGSPVFNAQWQVIGLHHAGSSDATRLHGTGRYEANEGIVLNAIASVIEKKLLA